MLLVGLGNPGTTYENTRHNIGFLVIDELLKRSSHSEIKKASFEGDLFKSRSTYLLKPTTFMNLSGNAIAKVKNFYKLEETIVIHDDIDLPFGALRFKVGGGHGGHNGLRSADKMIGKEYIRVRMGVGKPEHKSQVADYVLHDFNAGEQLVLGAWIRHTANSVEALLEKSLSDVASRFSLKDISKLGS